MKQKITVSLILLIGLLAFTTPISLAAEIDHGSEYSMDHNAWVLSISPQYKEIKAGETIPVRVTVSTNSSPIEQLTVALAFPADQLEVSEEDDKKSGFPTKISSKHTKGVVTLSRKTDKALTGEQEISTVYFKALKDTSTQNIIIDNTRSALLTKEGHNMIGESAIDAHSSSSSFSGFINSIKSFFVDLFN